MTFTYEITAPDGHVQETRDGAECLRVVRVLQERWPGQTIKVRGVVSESKQDQKEAATAA